MEGHQLIAQERERQIREEGFNSEHDAEHSVDVLVAAAISYAMYDQPGCDQTAEEPWPWDDSWWKPKDRRKNLIRAGALIAAAIDRLDRDLADSL